MTATPEATAINAVGLKRYGMIALDDGSDRMLPVERGQWVTFEEAAAEISRLTSALAGADWQPIDTSPRDGTWFLGFDDHRKSPEDQIDVWHWDKDAEDGGFWVNAADSNLDDYPSHWRPLPAPPAAAIRSLQEQE